MMISPEGYYEMNLKGKSQQEIMTEIRSLKREIGRLKRKLEEHCFDQKVTMYPNPLTRISCSRDYLERAKQAYEEAGGIYQPTKAELRDKAFNDGLLSTGMISGHTQSAERKFFSTWSILSI